MKNFYVYVLSLMIFSFGCSLIKKTDEVKPGPAKTIQAKKVFLSKSEIIARMEESPEVKFMSEEGEEYMDDAYKKRLDSLIPSPIFLEGMDGLQADPNEQSSDEKIPDSIDWTEFTTSVKDQNNGYCTAFATAGAVEASLCKNDNLCGEDLSEQYLFSLYNKYSTSKAVAAASKYWLADEKYWPKYGRKASDIKEFTHARISEIRYLGKNHDSMLAALARGHFVVIAMRTPKDMLSCRKVIRSYTRFSSGGHAIMAVGYEKSDKVKGGVYVKIKNSWGDDCGDHGFQYVPFKGICGESNAYCYYWEIIDSVSTKTSLCKENN
jgi:C1A family cysteine protease